MTTRPLSFSESLNPLIPLLTFSQSQTEDGLAITYYPEEGITITTRLPDDTLAFRCDRNGQIEAGEFAHAQPGASLIHGYQRTEQGQQTYIHPKLLIEKTTSEYNFALLLQKDLSYQLQAVFQEIHHCENPEIALFKLIEIEGKKALEDVFSHPGSPVDKEKFFELLTECELPFYPMARLARLTNETIQACLKQPIQDQKISKLLHEIASYVSSEPT